VTGVQEKDGEIIEAKVLKAGITLLVSESVEDAPEEKAVTEETVTEDSKGRVDEPEEKATTSEESETEEAHKDQEDREEEAVEEEKEAGVEQEKDLTVELRQRQLMLKARLLELEF